MAYTASSTRYQHASWFKTETLRLRAAWQQHRLYRRTLAEMRALSDRELADLGLNRTELRRVAREAVRDS